MPYTTPSTVTGSDVLTAALWNTQIRDNFEAVAKPPSVSVRLNTTISSYVDDTPIAWNATENTPTPGMWAAGSPSLITVPEAGMYLVAGTIRINTGPGGNLRLLRVVKNGSTLVAESAILAISQPTSVSQAQVLGGVAFAQSFSFVTRLAASDYIHLAVNVSGLNTFGASTFPRSIGGIAAADPNAAASTRASVTLIGRTA